MDGLVECHVHDAAELDAEVCPTSGPQAVTAPRLVQTSD